MEQRFIGGAFAAADAAGFGIGLAGGFGGDGIGVAEWLEGGVGVALAVMGGPPDRRADTWTIIVGHGQGTVSSVHINRGDGSKYAEVVVYEADERQR